MGEAPDFNDPSNKILLGVAHDLRENGFAMARHPNEKEFYFWGTPGLFHLRYIESFEFDGWEAFYCDSGTKRFSDEASLKKWILEIVQTRLDEFREGGI